MDRLETVSSAFTLDTTPSFTFQYGQIRNQQNLMDLIQEVHSLHSSMDRLETFEEYMNKLYYKKFTFQYGQIRNVLNKSPVLTPYFVYIPVWIDQKHWIYQHRIFLIYCLHSSMDRLETIIIKSEKMSIIMFTFQYGQIRNPFFPQPSRHHQKVYIPVWIDQKQRYKGELMT